MTENSAVFGGIGSSDPSQNAHVTGANVPANSRISPIVPSFMLLLASVCGERSAAGASLAGSGRTNRRRKRLVLALANPAADGNSLTVPAESPYFGPTVRPHAFAVTHTGARPVFVAGQAPAGVFHQRQQGP